MERVENMMKKINTRSKIQTNHKYQKFGKIFFPIGGAFYILLGILNWEGSPIWVSLSNIVMGVIFLTSPAFRQKYNVVSFTEDHIEYPSGKLFGKAKKQLYYKDIEQAVYLVGDFIFRNKEQEVRLAKEFLKEEDIRFLEEKLIELNDIKENEKN